MSTELGGQLMGLTDAPTNRILEDTLCRVCGRITRATGVVACYQGERIRTPAAFQLWGRASAVFLRLSLPATFSHLPLFLPRAPFTRRHSRRRLLLAHSQPLLYVSPTDSQPTTVSPTYGTTEPECFAKGWEAAGNAINAKNTETLAIPANKGLHNSPRWRWSSVTPFSCARTCKNGTNCFAEGGGVIITAYLCLKCNDPCTSKSGAIRELAEQADSQNFEVSWEHDLHCRMIANNFADSYLEASVFCSWERDKIGFGSSGDVTRFVYCCWLSDFACKLCISGGVNTRWR